MDEITAHSQWQSASCQVTSWLSRDDTKKIAILAHQAIKQNPNSRFFSLGNSPSWIVKAIEKESKILGQPIETGYIPFSGNFARLYSVSNYKGGKSKVFTFEIYEDAIDRMTGPEGINNYKQLLTAMDLAPESISKRFETNGTKTTLLEFCHSKGGLASFLHILFSWAKESGNEKTLPNALNIHAYSYKSERLFIKVGDDNPIPSRFHHIDYDLKEKLWGCDEDVRLVPSYRVPRWSNPPGEAEGDKAIIAATEQYLEKTVTQRLSVAAKRRTASRPKGGATHQKKEPLPPAHFELERYAT